MLESFTALARLTRQPVQKGHPAVPQVETVVRNVACGVRNDFWTHVLTPLVDDLEMFSAFRTGTLWSTWLQLRS